MPNAKKEAKEEVKKEIIMTRTGLFESVEMVRVSINLYPHQLHLIPRWVEERARHPVGGAHQGEKPKGEELFQLDAHVDLIDLEAAFSEMGMLLNRCHKKVNDGLGRTSQLMLVFDKGTEMPDERRREVLYSFLGYQDGRGGMAWKVKAFLNQAIARVPKHLYLQCGSPVELDGEEHSLDVNQKGAFTLVKFE